MNFLIISLLQIIFLLEGTGGKDIFWSCGIKRALYIGDLLLNSHGNNRAINLNIINVLKVLIKSDYMQREVLQFAFNRIKRKKD